MRSLFSIFSITLIALFLASCGPIYKTVYDYKPPASSQGKMCITQCVSNQAMCHQMCRMRNDTCQMQARQKAIFEFEHYKSVREKNHQPVEKTVRYFDESGECNDNCGCDETFNVCYTACGGSISERQVCTAFCDK